MDSAVIQWLLQSGNPAIVYRTRTEVLGLDADAADTLRWINEYLPSDWQNVKGLWYRYQITALAQCGLQKDSFDLSRFQPALDQLEIAFDHGCADLMLLHSLVQLGFQDEPVVRQRLMELQQNMLPDGGFLCLHRKDKMKYTPKSCYKANLHALLLAGECKKKEIPFDCSALAAYFFKRSLFYKGTEPTTLVLDARNGWRSIDTFFPFETARVGLQNVIEALCALGYGNDARLAQAWELLERNRDSDGRYILNGTLSKSYLPKERIGKPSYWVTFYALLAQKQKQGI